MDDRTAKGGNEVRKRNEVIIKPTFVREYMKSSGWEEFDNELVELRAI